MNIANILKGTGLIKTGVVSIFALLLTAATAITPVASANSGAEVIQVSGTFQTSTTSNLCDGIEDCVVDDLTGSFEGGTNRLITLDFVETPNRIIYTDATRVDTNGYGIFEGTERGVINVNTEEFSSHAQLTSTDGCGSKLILSYEGTIDLDSPGLEDEGTYEGVLIKKTC